MGLLYVLKARRQRRKLLRSLTEAQRDLVRQLRAKDSIYDDASAYDGVNLACGNPTSLAGDVASGFLSLLAQLRATGLTTEQERLLIYDELPAKDTLEE